MWMIEVNSIKLSDKSLFESESVNFRDLQKFNIGKAFKKYPDL